ncbi:MAG TPA: trigger factor [Candidatus Paceibacterota bacterium]
MQTSVKRNTDSTIEIEIELQPAELRPYLERAAKELAEKNPIEGFRPGKASFEVVKQKFGEMHLYERALAYAIDGTIPEILVKEKLRVVGKPEISVNKIAPGNPLAFTLKTAIIPDFTLPDIEAIAKKVLTSRSSIAVDEKEIADSIAWLQNSRAKNNPVTRPAAKGDAVEIDFTAKVAGKLLDRGSSENHPLIIGEGKFVAGFEAALVGMAKDEEKAFTISMPADYHESALAGKEADFWVRMKKIEERELPELNDEFAAGLGTFPSLEALKQNIREGITKEKEEKERERIRIAVMDAIAAKTEMAIPQTLIESELEKMAGELKANIESMGMNFEKYLEHLKKTAEDLKKEWADEAKRRVKIALILRAVAETKHLEPNDAEITDEINRILSRHKTPKAAAKDLDPEAVRQYARGTARNEKVFQWLESLYTK